MRFLTRITILIGLAGAVLTSPGTGTAHAAQDRLAPASPIAAARDEPCVPGGPCAHPLPVRIVIVTMFEIGKDSGDAPGEFQLWKERRHLDTRIPFPQSY